LQPADYELPFGPNPFAPSNARTTTATFIGQADFIPAARCASCHANAHSEWSESAHRNSFREPFYQANVKHLIRERGIAVTRHCESCHNPVALFSGALTPDSNIARPFDDEGVSCSVCHSIEATTTEGIGSYLIAPPAMLVRADGVRVRDAADSEIRADLTSHYRAVMRPLLKTPEFCAACHKAAVLPELNNRKWLRSFAVYDEWQQSAFSTETVQPLSRRDRRSCQDCHMPKSSGGTASHRWPGGNTALPAFYNAPAQLKATSDLLQSSVLTVDIFALRSDSTDPCDVVAPLDAGEALLPAGRKMTVDVVVANRGVGHSFPAELRDIFEAWLEFKATDAAGRVIAHSGAVRADGTLEWDAHAYRAVPIDNDGQPIIRHDIWNTRVTALDRQIAAGRADVGSFSFVVPADARSPITLTARLNYRRFNRRFTDWVSQDTNMGLSPVVEMAGASISLPIRADQTIAPASKPAQPRDALRLRWRAYGVALFDQQEYKAAAQAFEHSIELSQKGLPEEAASQIDLAMTCLRMERSGPSQSVLERADRAIARALEISPKDSRGRYYRALLNVKRFRYSEALAELELLGGEYPRDRQVWGQLAGLYFLQRRDRNAQSAYERILKIDPDDTEAHLKLAGLYWRFGMVDLAKREQDAYQARHSDTVAETMRRSYLRSHPEIYATWPWQEFGDNPIGSMP
jgi:tetratricopeptide (TPR) repeat protein